LKHCLDDHHVKYMTIKHSPAYTAQEIAESAHIRGSEMAKTVVVKLDGRLAMTVLPASQKLNLNLLKQAAGARDAGLAQEAEFKDKFPECELGAMPPFGNLYGIDTYVADRLTEDEYIAFNAGTHTELIRMRFRDFEHLAEPRILAFSR
jgi:Ala-tRNA(Pro) deacylase